MNLKYYNYSGIHTSCLNIFWSNRHNLEDTSTKLEFCISCPNKYQNLKTLACKIKNVLYLIFLYIIHEFEPYLIIFFKPDF